MWAVGGQSYFLRLDALSLSASINWTIDPYVLAAALNAALEDIANVQLAPDLLQVDGLALVR